jgi:hypothetical protein
MSDDIELTGWVVAKAPLHTAEDVRALAAWLNRYNVPNCTTLELDKQTVWVELVGENSVDAEWIECEEHIPPATAYDVIISTHGHGDPADAPSRPARFDWPTIDRYNVEGRPE